MQYKACSDLAKTVKSVDGMGVRWFSHKAYT